MHDEDYIKSKKRLIDEDKNKERHKIIDLRKAIDPDNDIYICEHCDVRLIPYFDIKGERLTRGKLFQCGRCGQIKDTTSHDLQKPESLTSRGDNMNVYFNVVRHDNPVKPKPFDIDPGDDLMYKGQGFHIVRTRITVNGKIVRDD
jgi:hypothetical protein